MDEQDIRMDGLEGRIRTLEEDKADRDRAAKQKEVEPIPSKKQTKKTSK